MSLIVILLLGFFFLLNGLLFLFLSCSFWFGLITTFFVQRLMYVTLHPISRIPVFILLSYSRELSSKPLGRTDWYQQSSLTSSPQLYPYGVQLDNMPVAAAQLRHGTPCA